MRDHLKQHKPYYMFAALLTFGCVIVITGILTGDMAGEKADPRRDKVAHNEKNADNAAREIDKVRNISRQTSNKDSDAIDRTPLGSVPHRALYEITMIKKHGGARISNVAGRMAFEWRPACDGWLSRHRFNMAYEYPDSPGARVVSRYTTLEAYDGRHMDFTSQRWRNGRVQDEYRGRAEQMEDGDSYRVSYTEPQGAGFEMPGDVMFPMAHTFATLQAAREGKTFFRAPVFDGHDDEGEVLINAFIGDTVNAMAHLDPSKAINTSLVNTKAWDVRMAFFPELEKDVSPDYELSAHLHDNSVISRMHVAYDQFTVQQELVALEKLDVEPCE